jgi:hypothetical protein
MQVSEPINSSLRLTTVHGSQWVLEKIVLKLLNLFNIENGLLAKI